MGWRGVFGGMLCRYPLLLGLSLLSLLLSPPVERVDMLAMSYIHLTKKIFRT